MPRYRLYTTLGRYSAVLSGIATGRPGGEEGALELFEGSIGRFVGLKHVVCMPMARVGVYFAIKSLIRPGQKVILSPYTIADVVNMVICAGGVPVFADIERSSCNISAEQVERLIDAQTGAVLITHLHGLLCDVEAIADLCKRKGVPLVEDAAQAFGASFSGKRAGGFGDAAVYSFGMYKNVNTFYGGALASDNKSLIDRVRSEAAGFEYESLLRLLKRVAQGALTDVVTSPAVFRAFTYWIFRFGYLKNIEAINRMVAVELDLELKENVPAHYLKRMRPLQARAGLSQVSQVDAATDLRISHAQAYHEGLSDLAELQLPPLRLDRSHIYTYFPVQFAKRESLLRFLMEHKRDVAPQHLKNCADLPAFAAFRRDCPNARSVANDLLLLPTYPRYGMREVQKNIEVVRAYFNA